MSMINATVTVVDSGLFTEVAVRLAREISHVRSAVSWYAEFPTINDRLIGEGLPDVEWVEDPFRAEIFDTTDAYVFPDIFRGGEQQLLKRLGKPVWGGDTGDELETRRIWFRHLQEKLGMPVPEYTVVTGIDELNAFLKDHGHCFVKTTSKIRGTMETHEFFSFDQSMYWLEDLKLKLGAGRDDVMFLIEEPVDSPFETGLDTYCIRGQIPKTPMQGIEVKGKLILSSAQTHSPTPKPMDDALRLLAPELERRDYRSFLSAEFRQDMLTDLCARAPNPGIGVEMEMIRNFGEIVYRGAHGELVEPDFEFEFGIQAAIMHDHDEQLPKQFPIPDDLRRWVKLMEFCKKGDLYQIVPRPPHGKKIGWLIGVGNTIEEANDHIQENAKALKDYPFDIKLDALADALKQAYEMEKQGMEFTDGPVPDPEELAAP